MGKTNMKKQDDQPQAAYEEEQKRLLNEVEDLMGPTPEENQGTLTSVSPSEEPEHDRPEDAEKDTDTETSQAGTEESTDEAVEAIVAAESDALLAAEDEKKERTSEPPKQKRSPAAMVRSLWAHRRLRNSLLALLAVGVVSAFAVPPSRYALLNAAGVRVSAHFLIVDEGTDKPLRNVDITVAGKTARTDDAGEAVLTGLRQGKSTLVIEKRSFASIEQPVTLGWGSNRFTAFRMTPTGASYAFTVTDWLSGKPLERVEFKSGDSGGFSSADGKATVTLDPGDAAELVFAVTMKDYRTEEVRIPASSKEVHEVKLVPSAKHYFMSRRSGTYDLYRIDADGANEELVLSGTGKERDDIVLSVNPDRTYVALVTTRKGSTNKDGYALQTLSVVTTETKAINDVSDAEQIRLIGWIGTKAVFVKVTAGPSGAFAYRQKIIVYDAQSGNLQDIATSDGFNDVVVIGERIYYAPGNIYGTEPEAAAFFSVKADATDKKTILERATWSALRTAYDTLSLSTNGNVWYSYVIGGDAAQQIATPTATPRNRQYVDTPSGSRSAWLDYRDGKGVVVLWEAATKEEKVFYSRGGLVSPLQWLDETHLVFRMATSEEVADYVISINGGEPVKIGDVAATATAGGSGYY